MTRVVVVDVYEPVLNVYDMGDNVEQVPTPGTSWHFGVSETNSMYGSWDILSVERVWSGRRTGDSYLRVNVKRRFPSDAA